MRCQRVLSLLSAYMDGEASPADSRMLEKHLAGCASCSRELALLQVTARMLATAPEVEPPESLLEQIEAVTIRRASFRQRLVEGFASIPAYGRWAAAATAAAGILLVILTSGPSRQIANQPSYRPEPPAVVQPEITEEPQSPTSVAVAEQPVKSYSAHLHRRHTAVAKASAKAAVAKITPAKNVRPVEIKTGVPADGPPALEPPASEAVANVASPGPEPVKGVEVAKTAPKPADSFQKENDSLAQLRAQLAIRNKNKKLQVKADPLEGHKVSIDLASVRF